jgi:hypothetical protein
MFIHQNIPSRSKTDKNAFKDVIKNIAFMHEKYMAPKQFQFLSFSARSLIMSGIGVVKQ